MRALFERSVPARWAAVAMAVLVVLGLVQASAAAPGEGLTLRTLLFGDEPAAVRPAAPPVAAPRHRRARRIWAASRSRPLRKASARGRRKVQVAAAPARRRVVAHGPKPRVAAAPAPKLVFLPGPPVPAIVSIFDDKTLRSGDAVMMRDGIHIFRASAVWPHRPVDFVRLAAATSLTWQLRQTFNGLDHNPPSRWAMVDPAG